MKKITLLLFFFITITTNLKASDFKFDKAYYNCENKWVVLPKLKEQDTTHMYGFVYLDRQAGFTFSYEGSLNVDSTGKINAFPTQQTHQMIYRIPNNFALLAILLPNQIKEMGISTVPDWLHFYTEGEKETKGLIERGYHFNHIGASDLAISPLEEAYNKDPHADGLEFELAYAYNATERHKEAIELLNLAIKNNSKNGRFYRELGYAYLKTNNIKEAEKVYKNGIDISNDVEEKAEMAFNVAGSYWTMKDKKGFERWSEVVKKYASPNSIYVNNLKKMELEFNK